jgi:hypothetical protein
MPAMRDYELIAAEDCPVCGRTDTLVAPDCTEGHGTDCPDRVCLGCGTALFVDPMMSAPRRRPVARIA